MTTELTFQVKGMHCGGCEQNVAFALGELDGVVDVEADHTAETVKTTLADDAVTPEEIVEAIEAMGYEVSR